MFKKTVYFIVFMSIFILSACASKEPGHICEVDHDIYEYLGIWQGDETDKEYDNSIILLKEYEHYQAYVAGISRRCSDGAFYDGLRSYDEDFFKDEMLIVLTHWETTGMSELSLYDVLYEDDNIEVVLKSVYPYATTQDMKDYGIIIRVPRNDNISTIKYRVISEQQLKWYERY